MPIAELENFRKKYPGYDDIDDTTLASKLAAKYPDAYGDLPSKISKPTPAQTPFQSGVSTATDIIRGEAKRMVSGEPSASVPYEEVPRTVGMIGGAALGAQRGIALGAPLGPAGAAIGGALGGVIGGGLGYSAGEEAKRAALGESKPLLEEAVIAGKNIFTGAAIEATSQLGGAGMEKIIASKAGSIRPVVDNAISKAIRPSVSGKSTQSQSKAYYDKANDAINTIVANKNNIKLLNESGEEVVGQLPRSLKQFSEAIEQSKEQIFNEYNALAKKTGQQGIKVNLNNTVSELNSIASNKVLNDLSPKSAAYAKEMADRLSKHTQPVSPGMAPIVPGRTKSEYTAEEAQLAIKRLNKSLEAYYKNPSYDTATVAGIDAVVANNLRRELDSAVESAAGKGYQQLKNKYGSLKSIEKDVNHRAVVDARKNAKGLIDFTDIASATEFVNGIVRSDPASFASAATINAVKNYIKKQNDPNNIIRSMFDKVDKVVWGKAKSSTPDIAALSMKSLSGGVSPSNDGYLPDMVSTAEAGGLGDYVNQRDRYQDVESGIQGSEAPNPSTTRQSAGRGPAVTATPEEINRLKADLEKRKAFERNLNQPRQAIPQETPRLPRQRRLVQVITNRGVVYRDADTGEEFRENPNEL